MTLIQLWKSQPWYPALSARKQVRNGDVIRVSTDPHRVQVFDTEIRERIGD